MRNTLKSKVLEHWDCFAKWVGHHQGIIRLSSLTAGLIVFFAVLSPTVRKILWEGLISHSILASMVLVLGLLAISLVWSAGQNLDAWIFRLFNMRGSRPVWLDRTMLLVTQLGSGVTSLVIALILFLVGNRLLSYELVSGTLALWLVVEISKFLIHRSRPYIRVLETRVVGYRAIGRSFPSGHTSQAFFIATLLAQHIPANIWIVVLLYFTALMVGLTRMYVGAHYPRDVLAGAILGSAWGLLGGLIGGYML